MRKSKNRDNYPIATSLGELFDSAAERFSERSAVVFDAEYFSYQDLQKRANQLASFLMSHGIKPGSAVAVCLSRSMRVPWTVLGILKAGAAYLPLDPEYPNERLLYMLENSGAKFLISESIFMERLPIEGVNSILLDKREEDIIRINPNPALPPVSPEYPAYLIYTSGSTGRPKGVVMPHAALVNLVNWQAEHPRLGNAAKTLQFTPLSFDVHFQEFFGTWSTGGSLVMVSEELRINALKLLQFLHEEEIERLYLPFVALQIIAEIASRSSEEKLIPNKLRDVITAGELLQINNHIADLFSLIPKCSLHNHYGPSETHVVTAYTLKGSPEQWPALPPIGKPIKNCSLYLLDHNKRLVKPGEEGEIYIGGICVAQGYVGLNDVTKESFIPDLLSKGGGRLYRTGDLAKKLPDGNFQFLGRIDGQVKIRGYRVEPAEIELALSSHSAVGYAIVTVQEDSRGKKLLVAYLVQAQSCIETSNPGAGLLRSYLEGKIPYYMIPTHFIWLESIPRTLSGKVDRKALPILECKRPPLDQQYVKPSGRTEERLSSLWRELLHLDCVGALDNLFDLGADSLLCIQSTARLYQDYGIDFPVAVIFQKPTIRALAKYLDHKPQQKRSRLVSLASGNSNAETKVAIIGMAGRFPGAQTIYELWRSLRNGIETTSFFSEDDLDPEIDVALRKDTKYVKARGVLQNAEMFDASFFGISPLEAQIIDPQQRIFLEIAYQALEDAGYSPRNYEGKIGVFAGSHNNSYYQSHVQRRPDLVMRFGEFQTMVANEKDYIATRVAHKLNCKGPAVSVYTACSTSLVATVLAVESLLNKNCDMALSGGVAVTVPQRSGYLYQEGAMLCKDGHCRPFDAEATGTVFSDGAGVVLLKRFDNAQRDGDRIIAVISGTALNNDGSEKMSFSAPSIEAQADVIAQAQARAGVTADTISYIEAHGTATPLGDPIEIAALTQVFREDTDKSGFCAIGSIKSNFGHLTAAAGIAGLIKVALSLKYAEIPPTLHFRKANTQIDFAQSPFYVNTELHKWEKGHTPRRAGISSFGVGGTNAHVILEEAPTINIEKSESSIPLQLFPFSARSTDALGKMIRNFSTFIEGNSSISFPDAAFTLQNGREHFKYRQIFISKDLDHLKKLLPSPDPGNSAIGQVAEAERSVAFLFPGQGSPYPGMGACIYKHEPIFTETVDACAEILEDNLKEDIREILFASECQSAGSVEKLKQTKYSQPAIFTLEYALARLWMHWGLEPKAMVGHSIGEFVCACLAGVFNLEDALQMVAARACLMQEIPGGSMLSVRLLASELEPLLNGKISIASIDSPSLCVVSGPKDAISMFKSQLKKKDIVSRHLHTSHAFHSPMMDSVVEPFLQIAKKISFSAPKIPFVSTATGTWIGDQEAKDPVYWASHLRKPVLFSQAVETLCESEERIMIEVGPRAALTTLSRQLPGQGKVHLFAASLGDKGGDSEWRSLLLAFGKLWIGGAPLCWETFSSGNRGRRVPLPTYPFEYKRCWIDLTTGDENSEAKPQTEDLMKDHEEQNMTQDNNARIHRLISEIQQVLEEVSGMEMIGTEADINFLDLGLDSLTLTQTSQKLEKRFAIEVTFRQLVDEFPNCLLLSKYLDKQLPPEKQQKPMTAAAINKASLHQAVTSPSAPVAVVTGSTSGIASPDLIENVISKQMTLMERQLEMLSGDTKVCPVEGTTEPQKLHTPELDEDVQGNSTAAASQVLDNSVAYGSTAPRRAFGAAAQIRCRDHVELSGKQRVFFDDLMQRYTTRTAESKRQTQQHRRYFADPRTVSGFSPLLKEFIYPIVTEKSSGAKLWDVDGNEYIDLIGGFGSNLFGNLAPFITETIKEQLGKGIEIGPQNPLAGEVAELVCELTGMERAAFCNTGSEAVLGTMRLARTVTGRDVIVIFEGAYHGILDEVIVRGGMNRTPIPAAAGVPASAVKNMLVLEYGSSESLEIIRSRAGLIAAVLVESVQSRRPDFQPREFLHDLRQLTQETDIPLIFDECITGFRVHPGGAQAHFGVHADLASYGKVAGGGLPFGIVAGKKQFMDAFDGGFWNYGDASIPETGVTYYAGTFTRHPLALAASKAVLLRLKEEGPSLQQKLNAKADAFVAELNSYFDSAGVPIKLANFGSMMNLTFIEEEPFSELLYVLLRLKGVYIWDARPSFLTLAHTEKDIELVIKAFKEAVRELQEAGLLYATLKSADLRN